MNVIDLIKDDHARVKGLFADYKKSAGNEERLEQICDTIIEELEIHAQLEEELLYPAMRKADGER
jgi:hemerythrin superfamily protein